MAKYEKTVQGDFNALIKRVEDGILEGSFSASLEERSDFISENSRCSVRVFERYSYSGKNRVSLNITFFQGSDGLIHVSAITSGGSQALLFKINTFGEESFLDELISIL